MLRLARGFLCSPARFASNIGEKKLLALDVQVMPQKKPACAGLSGDAPLLLRCGNDHDRVAGRAHRIADVWCQFRNNCRMMPVAIATST
jgi:hypothetical protein